jgi:hypothetical protein
MVPIGTLVIPIGAKRELAEHMSDPNTVDTASTPPQRRGWRRALAVMSVAVVAAALAVVLFVHDSSTSKAAVVTGKVQLVQWGTPHDTLIVYFELTNHSSKRQSDSCAVYLGSVQIDSVDLGFPLDPGGSESGSAGANVPEAFDRSSLASIRPLVRMSC